MNFEGRNNYNEIAEQYRRSDVKPDKKYSILPTTLRMIGDVKGKTVLDLGCGDGFFTRALGESGAKRVIGIDNSEAQIQLAKQGNAPSTVEYSLGDVFTDELPAADVINSPFVLNYAEDVPSLRKYLSHLFSALNPGGRLALVVDLPSGNNLEKFGAKKSLSRNEDGADITIELYNEGKQICTLHAKYFTEDTIRRLLQETGYENIVFHPPIISQEGKEEKGEEFWEGYNDNCELGYITADKPLSD